MPKKIKHKRYIGTPEGRYTSVYYFRKPKVGKRKIHAVVEPKIYKNKKIARKGRLGGRGRPKGIPCKWKGMRRPKHWTQDYRKVEIGGKYYIMTEKMKKFAETYMETGKKMESALVAYPGVSNPMASVLANRNLKHPLVQQYMKECIDIASDTIVNLARNAEKEETRLKASQDILDRLGFKAPDRLEIDDKRELSDIDREAMLKVQSVLAGSVEEAVKKNEVKEAEIVN